MYTAAQHLVGGGGEKYEKSTAEQSSWSRGAEGTVATANGVMRLESHLDSHRVAGSMHGCLTRRGIYHLNEVVAKQFFSPQKSARRNAVTMDREILGYRTEAFAIHDTMSRQMFPTDPRMGKIVTLSSCSVQVPWKICQPMAGERMPTMHSRPFQRSVSAKARPPFNAMGCGGKRAANVAVRAEKGSGGQSRDSPETVDISVFRFTLGIPGLDDSELPRIAGILFGGLLILNHVFSVNSMTAAQLRSEAVGLMLAAVSFSLPAISLELNGSKASNEKLSKSGSKQQIFSLADTLNDRQRRELAWASYTLLRNTNTSAVLICYSSQVVCARGLWGLENDNSLGASKILVSLKQRLSSSSLTNSVDPLYISTGADAQGMEIIPKGTSSMVVQPLSDAVDSEQGTTNQSFLLVISSTPRGYSRKDRSWIASLAKKLYQVLSQ